MAGNRPTGVTVLAILTLLGSLYELYNASIYLEGGSILTSLGITGYDAFFYAEGAVSVVFAVWGFMVAYSFWTGRGWGWMVGVLYTIVSILNGIAVAAVLPYADIIESLAVGIVIDVIILFYLFRPNTKAYFGRGAPMGAPPPPPPPP